MEAFSFLIFSENPDKIDAFVGNGKVGSEGSGYKKMVLILVGTLSLVIGIIGIFLPVLPTTPFLLLAMACYLRSSKKLYSFILNNKYLGPYVRDYISGRGIPVKMKWRAIFLIWLTIGFSIIFIIDNLLLRIMLFGIASLVSIYIWTRKTAEV